MFLPGNESMKKVRAAVCGGGALVAATMAQGGVVDGNERELFSSGDFDGDGIPDVVVVDRESGYYRIGTGLQHGGLSWEQAFPSGMRGVDDFAAGRLLEDDRDGLAFASRRENRINYGAAFSPAPASLFGNLIGPGMVVALPVAGDRAVPGLEDLVSSGQDAGLPLPYRFYVVRNLGEEGFADLHASPAAYRLHAGNRFHARTGEPPLLSLLQRREADAEDRFFLLEVSDAGFYEHASMPLPAGSGYVHGDFLPSGIADLIAWIPGETEFSVYYADDDEGTIRFEPRPAVFAFKEPIERIRVLREAGAPRLLVLYRDGTATLYAFDGRDAPAMLARYVPAGEKQAFTGAAMLGDDGFVLFSGPPGGRSTDYLRVGGADADYAVFQAGTLPAPPAGETVGNLLLFADEPFVSPEPLLLGRMAAGVWASQPAFTDSQRTVGAVVERFGGGDLGLHDPLWETVGQGPDGSEFLLANQYGLTDSVSFFSFDTHLGEAGAVPRIQPYPGHYPATIEVAFPGASTFPGRTVFYRTHEGGAWQAYEHPFPLYRDTVVEFFSETDLGQGRIQRSPMGEAAYSFALAPENMDSDGDGVPDFVKIFYGLDPLAGGADSDGDGVSDLEEILAGTDPTDPDSYPADREALDLGASFDLSVLLRPDDGTGEAETTAAEGTGVRTYGHGGRLLRSVRLDPDSREFPGAILPDVPREPSERFFAVRTDAHYPVATEAGDLRIGREMIRLVGMPRFPPPEVDFRYGETGGGAADEVAAWVEAARKAFSSERQRLEIVVDSRDTLHAALVEYKIAALLETRGILDPAESARPSIFPFRGGDAGRRVLSRSEVLALERTPGEVYSLEGILTGIEDGLFSGAIRDSDTLLALAGEVYRISIRYNNDEPGLYPLPLDVFREFLVRGTLPESYLGRTRMEENEIDRAHLAARDILDLPAGARLPLVWDLEVIPESFGPACTVLRVADGPETVSLFDRNGSPYAFPAGFPLAAGSRLEVEGYRLAPAFSCSGEAVEVLSLALRSVPVASPGDTDGNLLPDSWERFFFGHQGLNPFASYDGSGYSALQQYLEGTDPTDPGSLPGDVPRENLSPPAVHIDPVAGDTGQLELAWSWPGRYAGRVRFNVEVSDGLNGQFTGYPVTPVHDGNGGFAVRLPRPESDRYFYRLVLALD